MSTVIRIAERTTASNGIAFNFDDMSVQAKRYLEGIRAEAAKIIATAHREAEIIRRRAEHEGRQAAAQVATQAAEQTVERQLTTIMPGLRKAITDIEEAKQAWLAHWEASAIHAATAIAARVLRRELANHPEIPLVLVREALELAAGTGHVRILLNSADFATLEGQVRMLTQEIARLGEAEVIADPSITPGGCRVETSFGAIDQQFDVQLARIEEELAP